MRRFTVFFLIHLLLGREGKEEKDRALPRMVLAGLPSLFLPSLPLFVFLLCSLATKQG
jgi:hypothetical protein